MENLTLLHRAEPLTLESFQVGILCALPIELRAIKLAFDELYPDSESPTQPSTDKNSYVYGRIGDHKVVAAPLPKGITGLVPAAYTVTTMSSTFPNLRFGLFIGIGGGIPKLYGSNIADIRLGDIVVSTPEGTHGGVVQYNRGKIVDGVNGVEFERVGALNKPPLVLLNAVGAIEASMEESPGLLHEKLDEMLAKVKDDRKIRYPGHTKDRLFHSIYSHPPGNPTCDACNKSRVIKRDWSEREANSFAPQVFTGTIASDSMVVKDSRIRDQIQDNFGAKCVEMEAAGIMDFFPCLVIRGISDYADSHKNDDWHRYAALSAAAYGSLLLHKVQGRAVAELKPTKAVIEDGTPLAPDNGALVPGPDYKPQQPSYVTPDGVKTELPTSKIELPRLIAPPVRLDGDSNILSFDVLHALYMMLAEEPPADGGDYVEWIRNDDAEEVLTASELLLVFFIITGDLSAPWKNTPEEIATEVRAVLQKWPNLDRYSIWEVIQKIKPDPSIFTRWTKGAKGELTASFPELNLFIRTMLIVKHLPDRRLEELDLPSEDTLVSELNTIISRMTNRAKLEQWSKDSIPYLRLLGDGQGAEHQTSSELVKPIFPPGLYYLPEVCSQASSHSKIAAVNLEPGYTMLLFQNSEGEIMACNNKEDIGWDSKGQRWSEPKGTGLKQAKLGTPLAVTFWSTELAYSGFDAYEVRLYYLSTDNYIEEWCYTEKPQDGYGAGTWYAGSMRSEEPVAHDTLLEVVSSFTSLTPNPAEDRAILAPQIRLYFQEAGTYDFRELIIENETSAVDSPAIQRKGSLWISMNGRRSHFAVTCSSRLAPSFQVHIRLFFEGLDQSIIEVHTSNPQGDAWKHNGTRIKSHRRLPNTWIAASVSTTSGLTRDLSKLETVTLFWQSLDRGTIETTEHNPDPLGVSWNAFDTFLVNVAEEELKRLRESESPTALVGHGVIVGSNASMDLALIVLGPTKQGGLACIETQKYRASRIWYDDSDLVGLQ